MSRRRSLQRDRALRLLYGGLLGGHLGAVLTVVALGFWHGPRGAATAAIAAAITLLFYALGQSVQVVMADADPMNVLFASVASYAFRVVALGALLAWSLLNPERMPSLDKAGIVAGTIVVVIAWLVGETVTFARLRIPAFDPPAEH